MKKSLLIAFSSLFLLVAFYVVWLNLPVTINRCSDIRLANGIIEQIEKYRTVDGIPETDGWSALKKFGFKDKGEFPIPTYEKLNYQHYQLTFYKGFDGPYLTWNAISQEWKEANPLFPDEQLKKETTANI